jgi:hypothetical protein
MPDLEQRLRALGAHIEFPETPQLAGTLDLARPEGHGRAPRRLVLALACIVLLLGVGTAFAVPASRHAILEWLGLRGVTVERVVSLPSVPASADLALGEEVSLEEAGRAAQFEVLVPDELGRPDEVYVDETTPGGKVTFVYRDPEDEPAALLTEFRGDLAPDLIGKLVAANARAQAVSVAGEGGVFLSGGPHVVFYRDADGEIREETLRLAGNTLLWQRGDVLLRLESALSLEESLRVARSTGP